MIASSPTSITSGNDQSSTYVSLFFMVLHDHRRPGLFSLAICLARKLLYREYFLSLCAALFLQRKFSDPRTWHRSDQSQRSHWEI